MITPINNMNNNIVDAVFVIGTGSKNNNEELRYALRNIEKNCPFIRNIYISGECPEWVNTNYVKHLKWPDRFSHAKDANIIDKLRHACEQPGIAKNILFCSDDQFQTKVCTWENFKPLWLRKYTSDDSWYTDKHRIWHNRLRATLERDRLRRQEAGLDTSNVYYYQPHMWMQIDRDKFIEYAKWSDYEHREDTIIASGYFNYIDADGIQNTDHVFISPAQKWPVNATHIAYTDSSFSAAMQYLKKEFNVRSKYELTDIPYTSLDETDKPVEVDTNALSTNVNIHTPIPATLEEVQKLYAIKSTVSKNSIWGNILKEMNEAEYMRLTDAPGWKRVWNDIIKRWAVTTHKGKLFVPVPSTTDVEIQRIVEAFKNTHIKKSPINNENTKKIENKDNISTEKVNTEKIEKRSCSRCEAKRKQMLAKNRINNETLTESDISLVKDTIIDNSKDHNTGHESKNETIVAIDNADACADCVLEHLSTAIAYLNSNAQRPLNFEVTLAYGEVKVAANHLIALKEDNLYNKCTKILDSYNSETSLFTVPEIKNLLAEASKKLY